MLKVFERIIIVVVVIGITAVLVKAAGNHLDSNEIDNLVDGCPSDMVFVPSNEGGFCLDKYEASADENCAYPEPSSQYETRINLDTSACKPVSVSGAIPWRAISQDQAAVACAKAGKRLATNKEWLAGSLGTPDKARDWIADDCQVNNNWEDQPGLTGSGHSCISAAGAYDMIGNVWEWVEGAAIDGKYNNKELPDAGYVDSLDGESLPGITNNNTPNENYNEDYFWVKKNGPRGIVRGGYWNNKSDAGQYSVYMVASPGSVEAGIGFRCVR